MKQPKVSVIIPVKNMANKIEQCLEAIFSQSLRPHEVLIVDGNSVDGTVERAEKFPVRVFNQDYGAAGAARQIGLENAQGDYVAFTDGDCIPGNDWLQNLLAGFEEGIVGVGGRIENIGKGIWTLSINLAFSTFLGSGRSIQGRLFNTRRFVRSISGCNSVYRKGDLVEIGGFDRSLSGADETELNARLLKIGKLLYVPQAVVLHDHGRGLKEFARNMYHYGGWRRESGVWDLPVVIPLIVPIILLSLIFTRWVVLALLALYFILLTIMGLKSAIQKKDIRYLVLIPIIYVVEHLCYVIGFWKEVVRPTKMR